MSAEPLSGLEDTSPAATEANKSDNSDSKDQSHEADNSKRVVDIYLEALVHSVACTESSCRVEKCRQFKTVVRHFNSCEKVNSQCDYCRQLVALCVIHAKTCRDDGCRIPDCHVIKVKLASLEELKAKTQSILEFIGSNVALLGHKSVRDCQSQTDEHSKWFNGDDENERKRSVLVEKINLIKSVHPVKLSLKEEKLFKFERKLRNQLIKQLIESIVDKFCLKEKNFYKNVSYASLVVYVIKTESNLYSKTNNSDDYLCLMSELVFGLEKRLRSKTSVCVDSAAQVDCGRSKNALTEEDSDQVPPSKKLKLDN
ncbi:CREB-binding -like isoform X2 [Brachionus plicatilis]|uniref:histone acetyltransferase n=1 Tax=Brachionus plicatilis TaxID=10195 RepID=A0A3M7SUZ8_BRAPC|nr:CREB-binding -like isoform X2 [Brachionus plicatilis]